MKSVLGLIAVLAILLPAQAFAQEATVARAQFTTGIDNREPVDAIESRGVSVAKIYFFTEFQGMEGQTIIHRWKYRGETKAELSFAVKGQRWRVYSSKNMIPEWTADWTVDVVDSNGNVLVTKTLGVGS
jgi:hypothetical protein